MGKDILPTEKELHEWFLELYLHPEFIHELSDYKRDKVYHFCLEFYSNLRAKILGFAFDKHYLKIKSLSEDQRRDFINELMVGDIFYSEYHKAKTVFSLFGKSLSDEGHLNFKGLIVGEKPHQNPIGIRFEDGVADILFKGLKPYFNQMEYQDLENVLNGKKIGEPLTFNGNKNQLPELFKRLYYNQKILLPAEKTKIAKWLVTNFKTSKGDLNEKIVGLQLSKVDSEVSKSKRLCPEINHLTPNQQADNNQSSLK